MRSLEKEGKRYEGARMNKSQDRRKTSPKRSNKSEKVACNPVMDIHLLSERLRGNDLLSFNKEGL